MKAQGPQIFVDELDSFPSVYKHFRLILSPTRPTTLHHPLTDIFINAPFSVCPMAQPVKKAAKAVDKWKKKRWFRILAPKLFKEQEVGETLAYEADGIIGRTVQVNMATLTNNIKNQNMNITFEVNKVQGETCFTNVKRFEVIPSTIRRKIKKGKDRVDDSFIIKTKDEVSIRVKPIIITEGKVSNSIKSMMKKRFMYDCQKECAEKSWDAILLDVLTGKIIKESKRNISKIYPVRSLEMRVIERFEGQPQESAELVFNEEQQARRPRRTESAETEEASAEEKSDEKTES